MADLIKYAYRLKGGGDEETKSETHPRPPRIMDAEIYINHFGSEWNNTRARIVRNGGIDDESRAELREIYEDMDYFERTIRTGRLNNDLKEYLINLITNLRTSINRFLSGIEQM